MKQLGLFRAIKPDKNRNKSDIKTSFQLIANFFNSNNTINYLDFGYNLIGNDAIDFIGNICNCTSIKKWCFGYNSVGTDCGNLLSKTINNMSLLTDIDLSFNNLNNATQLLKQIVSNRTITNLNLRGNLITESAIHVIDIIQHNTA